MELDSIVAGVTRGLNLAAELAHIAYEAPSAINGDLDSAGKIVIGTIAYVGVTMIGEAYLRRTDHDVRSGYIKPDQAN